MLLHNLVFFTLSPVFYVDGRDLSRLFEWILIDVLVFSDLKIVFWWILSDFLESWSLCVFSPNNEEQIFFVFI